MTKTGSLAPVEMNWPGTDLALHDRAAERRIDRCLGADLAGLLECRDLFFRASEDPQAVMGRLEGGLGRTHVVLRGGEIVLRVLPVLERHRLAGIELVLTLLVDLCQLEFRARAAQRAQRRDEIVERLHGVGGFDDEQLLPAPDDLAGLHHELHDAAGIGREDRRR